MERAKGFVLDRMEEDSRTPFSIRGLSKLRNTFLVPVDLVLASRSLVSNRKKRE